MPLTAYTPLDVQLDQFFKDTLRTVGSTTGAWTPACNVYEDKHGFRIEAALPGIEATSVEIVAEDGVLTLKGERKEEPAESGRTYLVRETGWGAFSRSFVLPPNVDHNKATAAYKDGMLSIQIPKRDEAKPRRIVIHAD
jgi:HSP20 family protein